MGCICNSSLLLIGRNIAELLGFNFSPDDAETVIGLGLFITPEFLWFDLYYILSTLIFYIFGLDTHLISGSMVHTWIITSYTYGLYDSQVSVVINLGMALSIMMFKLLSVVMVKFLHLIYTVIFLYFV